MEYRGAWSPVPLWRCYFYREQNKTGGSMAQTKDIKEKILWVIQSTENQKGGGGTDLRVIQWIIDGKPSKPALEKRDWYQDEQGDRKLGKAKGMTAGDFYLIIKNLRAIAKLLEVKQNHLDEALQLMDFQEPPASAPKPSSASSTPKGPATSTAADEAFRQAPPPEPVAASGKVPEIKF
jgi:hypothetical protein